VAVACSIGAKVLDPGRGFVLYKNRDFARPHFEDRVVYTDRLFALEGIESWDEQPGGDVFSGYSAGVNAAGLACADANVAMRPGATNYDVLVQLVLERCDSVVDGVRFLEREVVQRPYSWANLVLADRHGVAAVEVRDTAKVILHPRQINRANHHAAWGPSPLDQDTTTSRHRFLTARDLLDLVQDLDGVLALCRSHQPSPGATSICRHGAYTTVYSYVFDVTPEGATLHVRQGNPCLGDYTAIPLRFPADHEARAAVLRAYPSSFSRAAAEAAAIPGGRR
jgi:predicted choloylglycine hydrolase